MENQFNNGLRLSLEEMALRRVAVKLWIGSDTVAALKSGSSWDVIEGKIKNKVSELELPKLLQKRIMPLINYIGTDILNWQTFHGLNFRSLRENVHISELHWTCAGTLEYEKTAKDLITLETLNVVTRFRLACLYCFENHIRILWNELPERYKNSFREQQFVLQNYYLECYWVFTLQGKAIGSDRIVRSQMRNLSINMFAFEKAIQQGNKAAVDYFYRKLTNVEREFSLEFAVDVIMEERFKVMGTMYERYRSKVKINFPRQTLSALLFHLLSLMTPEQHKQVFKKFPCKILVCLLDCQLKDHLLDMADQIWTYVDKNRYNFVEKALVENLRCTNNYFPGFFQRFFLCSPVDFRNHFINQECIVTFTRIVTSNPPNRPRVLVPLLRLIFNAEDFETLKVIFSNISPANRVKLFFSKHVFHHLRDLILMDSWEMVEVCLHEAMFPPEEKEKIKETYSAFLTETDRDDKAISQKWEKFFRILDGTELSADNKRSSEDETGAEPKRLCSEEENVSLAN